MRRVAFRITFEALDRRENPGTSWGIFGLLGEVSSLLDNSHSKAKPEQKANHPAVALVSDRAFHPTVAHPIHAEYVQMNHNPLAEAARAAWK